MFFHFIVETLKTHYLFAILIFIGIIIIIGIIINLFFHYYEIESTEPLDELSILLKLGLKEFCKRFIEFCKQGGTWILENKRATLLILLVISINIICLG